jgi:replication factor C small subunit
MDVWVEKYRPDKLDDIIGQDVIIKRLKYYVISKNLPNLLFSGPPGCGKTASAISLVKELYGDMWGYNFIELNASDENGIGVVRGKIKDFARSSTVGDAEFKVVFMDESDALTSEAQAALRRTMENYTNICRFIISCNYSSKIIEPIQSRCSVYRFRRLSDEAIIERIIYIVKEEGLDISPGAINAIKYISQGDMRRAINALQSAAIIDNKIDADMIYKTSALAKPEDIDALILLSLEGNFIKAHGKLDYLLNDEGLAGPDITGQIYKQIFKINIPDRLKMNLIDFIGEIDFRISEGANEELQLGTLLSKFMLYGINES